MASSASSRLRDPAQPLRHERTSRLSHRSGALPLIIERFAQARATLAQLAEQAVDRPRAKPVRRSRRDLIHTTMTAQSFRLRSPRDARHRVNIDERFTRGDVAIDHSESPDVTAVDITRTTRSPDPIWLRVSQGGTWWSPRLVVSRQKRRRPDYACCDCSLLRDKRDRYVREHGTSMACHLDPGSGEIGPRSSARSSRKLMPTHDRDEVQRLLRESTHSS